MNISDKENFDKNQTDFRRVLLNCCQKQFELREKIEADYKEKIKNDMKEVTDPVSPFGFLLISLIYLHPKFNFEMEKEFLLVLVLLPEGL